MSQAANRRHGFIVLESRFRAESDFHFASLMRVAVWNRLGILVLWASLS
jgi:hypothetical protein